ncbi:MAG: para-nitrobenzyl esterase [Actinomycetota bacterium]|nr:para-nitrobenzyl esterase [Actinomycetota bacterium]
MRRLLRIATAVAALAALPAAVSSGPATPNALDADHPPLDVVNTDSGPVRGSVAADRLAFSGIPYAAAPTGALRWHAPQPPRRWTTVRDATAPASPCPQLPSSYAQVNSVDEDCLVLNVTTPRAADHSRSRPVMVWIHGDGAVGAGHFFDPTLLSTVGDVVVVTINYRLGVFGGFGLPGLTGSGTFGLQDQQAALRWVRRNIAGFGGDPSNVTVFGVSYGALAVTAHLVAPGSAGLFDRAVVQSGFGLVPLPAGAMYPGGEAQPWMGWRPEREVAELGEWVASELGCAPALPADPSVAIAPAVPAARAFPAGPTTSTAPAPHADPTDPVDPTDVLTCLRALPVEKILEFGQVMNIFQPVAYGGATLPELPAQALRSGHLQRVPVLSGATRDEHRTFVGLFRVLPGAPVTKEDYPGLVSAAFGPDQLEQILRRYPLAEGESPSLTWASVLTDGLWARATFEQNRLFAARTPTYAYEFADRDAPAYLPFPPDFPAGAHHAADTPYLFPDAQFTAAASAAQGRLSERIIRCWSAFARTGDPDVPGTQRWERFRPEAAVPYVQSLAPDRIGPVDYAREHQLDFWSGVRGSGVRGDTK